MSNARNSRWPLRRLKFVAALTAGQSPEGSEVNDEGDGLPFLQGCAEFGSRVPSADRFCANPPKIARAGSWLVSVRAPVGRINRADQPYGIGRGLAAVEPSFIDAGFLGYVLEDRASILDSLATGSTFTAVSIPQLGSLEVPIPPLATQAQIAILLDAKITQIDALIGNKQKLLKRLAEKRQAIITQAVTKGLDPRVPMKDSGIEWLGPIPAHWELKRLRFVGRSQNGINIGGEFFGSGHPFVSYGDVYNNYALPEEVVGQVESSAEDRRRYSVRRGDIFFTRTSETVEEIGFSSICLKDIEDACFAGFLIRVRPSANMLLPEFSRYYFRHTGHRAFLVKEMNLVTRASLGQTLLGNVPVLLPPLTEQKEIANHITLAMLQIDSISTRCATSIDHLFEYRSALITAAVTGQLEALQ